MTDRKILEGLIKKYGKQTILNELDTAMFKNASLVANRKGRYKMADKFEKEYNRRYARDFRAKVEDTIGFPNIMDYEFPDEKFKLSYVETSPRKGTGRIVAVILKFRNECLMWFDDVIYDELNAYDFCKNILHIDGEDPNTQDVDIRDIIDSVEKAKFSNRANARKFVNLMHQIIDEQGLRFDPLDWHDFADL